MASIKLPTDDVRKFETCGSFDGLYVKLYIVLTYGAFVGVTS